MPPKKPLDRWLTTRRAGFPPAGGRPYPDRFKSVGDYLNNQIHPHVEKGPLLQGDGFLTDHGPDHIETVIERAGALLAYPEDEYPQLTAYEVYLLLMAAHFHDVGNIFGRAGHEQKLGLIMEHLNGLLGAEMVERQAIIRIARAHGGNIDGDRDTINALPRMDPVLGQDVRYQSLAAILRLADELSDDCRRAARALQAIGVIPAQSEVFHAYAATLHSVQIRPEERVIMLRYSLTKADATRTFGKGNAQVYLLDEIFSRTLKMHFEREYCMRFTERIVRLDAIDVRIEVYQDGYSPSPCLEPIGYRLKQKGYPSSDGIGITALCPELSIDGPSLRAALEGAARASA